MRRVANVKLRNDVVNLESVKATDISTGGQVR